MRRWEAWLNHAGWGLAAVSGLAYGILKYFAASPDPDSRVAHPLQPALLAAHVLVVPAAVFGLGLVFRRHALARWQARERPGRRTGGLLLMLGPLVIASGYLVQVLTGEAARRWTGWGHAAAGALVAVAYALHPRRSRLPDDPAEAAPETKNAVG